MDGEGRNRAIATVGQLQRLGDCNGWAIATVGQMYL
jgi:hypothetical protein